MKWQISVVEDSQHKLLIQMFGCSVVKQLDSYTENRRPKYNI